MGERWPENPLRDDLNRDVEERDETKSDRKCARDGARRFGDFAACGERNLHARENEKSENQRAADARCAGRNGLRKIGAMDRVYAGDYKDGEWNQFHERGRVNKTRALFNAENIDEGYCANR